MKVLIVRRCSDAIPSPIHFDPGGVRSSGPPRCGRRGSSRRWMRSNLPPAGRPSTSLRRGKPSMSSRTFLTPGDDQLWWDDAQVARHVEMLFRCHIRQMDALAAASRDAVLCTGFRRIREGRQRLEVRFDGVAGCLRTPRGGSAKQIVLMRRGDELRMRWMTPREYARLQSAPDYTLPPNAIQLISVLAMPCACPSSRGSTVTCSRLFGKRREAEIGGGTEAFGFTGLRPLTSHLRVEAASHARPVLSR